MPHSIPDSTVHHLVNMHFDLLIVPTPADESAP